MRNELIDLYNEAIASNATKDAVYAYREARDRIGPQIVMEEVLDNDALRARLAEVELETKKQKGIIFGERKFSEALCNDLRSRLAEVEAQSVHVYNSGYHAGHHDTVEGRYVDIHPSDMGSYHAEEVEELREALAKLEEK